MEDGSPLAVFWTLRARRDVEVIHAHVAEAAPIAAGRLRDRLLEAADSLSTLPDRYRAAGRTRELVVIRPYILRYQVIGPSVFILRVRHGARRPLRG
jgi:toxin ParE1/3/4